MHRLITGTTGSGKSTLAKHLAAGLASRGVVVYDPLASRWPGGVRVFSDVNQVDIACRSPDRPRHVIVDEGATALGRERAAQLAWLWTMGRNLGLNATIITQHPSDLLPVIRAQCDQCVIFANTQRVYETLAMEYNSPELLAVGRLDRGEAIVLGRFTPMRRLRLFDG